jgi:hypothetical protein
VHVQSLTRALLKKRAGAELGPRQVPGPAWGGTCPFVEHAIHMGGFGILSFVVPGAVTAMRGLPGHPWTPRNLSWTPRATRNLAILLTARQLLCHLLRPPHARGHMRSRMVTKKRATRKSGSKNGRADVRALGVVMEQMRSELRVVAEAVAGVNGRLDNVDRRFEQMEQRFDQRFDAMDAALATVNADLGLVKIAVLDNSREIKDMRHAVEDVDSRKVDRDELPSPPRA